MLVNKVIKVGGLSLPGYSCLMNRNSDSCANEKQDYFEASCCACNKNIIECPSSHKHIDHTDYKLAHLLYFMSLSNGQHISDSSVHIPALNFRPKSTIVLKDMTRSLQSCVILRRVVLQVDRRFGGAYSLHLDVEGHSST